MAKRGNGEGSIFKRANGRWYSALTYRDDFGEVQRREVSGRTQAEVRAKLRELRERVETGAPVKDASITVAAWLEDWTTKALPASDRKQATVDLYATIARGHLVPILGSLQLDRLRPSDVEALVLAKRRGGLSASSVRTIYTVLRAALDVAVRDGLIQRNPAALVKRPAVERKDAGYLPPSRRRRCSRQSAATASRPSTASCWRPASAAVRRWPCTGETSTSMRPSSGCGGRCPRTSAGLELGEPKTEKSRRTVPLPVPAVETLRAHRKRQAAEQLAAGSLWQASGGAVTAASRTPLEPRHAPPPVEALAGRARLRGVQPHTLR